MLFVIKKLIAPFLLPPGLFIVLLAGLSLWGFRRGDRRVPGYLLPAAFIIWLLSMGPVSNALIKPLEAAYPIPETIDADVIVMLTGGMNLGAPDLSGHGTPGPSTMERMVTAARLHRKLGVPIIVSGGHVFSRGPAISHVTQRFLVDLGIEADQIIMEDRSRDTFENAVFSNEIIMHHGYTRPLLVTSASHMRRSMLSFDRAGLHPTAFPCAHTTWPDMDHSWRWFLPSARALYSSSAALHEWLGLAFYYLTCL